MSNNNNTIPLILSLLITLGITGVAIWGFKRKFEINLTDTSSVIDQSNTPLTPPLSISATSQITFAAPKKVPPGTTIKINGSATMVQINQAFKNPFEQKFPETKILTNAQGTNAGIELLLAGKVDIAAISRSLTAEEQAQGLVAVPIVQDAIAIVVGVNNPFRRGLTKKQVIDIFQGKITNWSGLEEDSATIKVINRPNISVTHQVFQELVLQGQNFGNTPNITMMEKDVTIPILRALGQDGISYATYTQVANQRDVRIVSVNGLTPEAINYPYQRTLYYAYKEPANSQVQAFLGYVLSAQGQKNFQKYEQN